MNSLLLVISNIKISLVIREKIFFLPQACFYVNYKPREKKRIIVNKVPLGKRREKRRGPTADDDCFKCGKRGHWANECREFGGRGDSRGRDHDMNSRKK